ncbi:MAG: hypothetical protein EBX07_08850, partial [Burkholderiaceae bacterium]|nr:hypothetical protein [Burkholderiaceae bacterium]
MLDAYQSHVAERAAQGIPALPLTKDQTAELVKMLQNPPKGLEAQLLDLISYRVPAGVDEAAKVKAEFLDALAKGKLQS